MSFAEDWSRRFRPGFPSSPAGAAGLIPFAINGGGVHPAPDGADGPQGLVPYAVALGPTARPAGAPGPAPVGPSRAVQPPPVPLANRSERAQAARALRKVDQDYLDRYYAKVSALADQYGVDPALPLGMGGESGFATGGTYNRTHDAFGMTGGSTRHMTYADTPEQNAQQLFDAYGPQFRGSGSDVDQFINGIQGRGSDGAPVKGWKRYNSVKGGSVYEERLKGWIQRMQRDVPTYQQTQRPSPR